MSNVEVQEPAEITETQTSKEELEKTIHDSKAEIEKLREESALKIEEIKAKLSKELEFVEENISQLSKEKKESIHDLELKKLELKDITDPEEFCLERHHILKELAIAEKDIVTKTISITALDQTISKLDEQIAKIQARHDKAIAQLELKRRTLHDRLQYFDTLNEKLAAIARLLEEENAKYNEDHDELMRRRSELLKRTDLSETTLNRMLAELDEEINELDRKHEIFVKEANYQISDLALEPIIKGAQLFGQRDQFLTEKQLRELKEFERQKRNKMTKEERLALLRMGLQITPSGRIITKDDRVITLAEARRLGLLCYLYSDTCAEEEEDYYEPPYEFKISEKELFYGRSSSRSSSFESSESSSEQFLSGQDVAYLKRVFGKSLSLALAEITAVQPSDPIHYLAHWLIKYRYNQEIDEIRRVELQELMIERERLEAEKWARELREEAQLAVLEILYRAENIIMQREYELERLAMLASEYEGEFEADMYALNPLEMAL